MRTRSRKGSALIVVLTFVAIFGTLSVGYILAANVNLKNAQLFLNSHRARLAAESGLTLARQAFPGLDVQSAATAAETLQAMAADLNTKYRGTLFNGQSATVAGNRLTLPAIILNFAEAPSQFQLSVVPLSDTQYTVESHGSEGACAKSLYINLTLGHDTSVLTEYGVASRGQITMTGNPNVTGLHGTNDPTEGSILAANMTVPAAIQLTGNVFVSGNVNLCNPQGNASMTGNSHIAGQVQIGVTAPPFPTIDQSPFIPYATNIIANAAAIGNNRYFENIRIKANANPSFNSNTVIRGVIYVESPNRVTFGGNLDFTGVVVTQTPSGPLNLAANVISFSGNCSTHGVAALPAGSQFDGLRNLTGSFVLAQGFSVQFGGNFQAVNGSILASQVQFIGNASGTIHGSVLNCDDTQYVMAGNGSLLIDHSSLNTSPAGMIFPRKLFYTKGSYDE